MSMILEKNKKYEKKKLGILKKKLNNPQEKSNLNVKSVFIKSPRQNSFLINKKRNLKSNDIYDTKNTGNENDDINFLLSNENDPLVEA